MSRLSIPDNLKGKELYNFLVKNKQQIFATKKADIKYSDGLFCSPELILPTKTDAKKDANGEQMPPEDGVIKVKIVGNSSWWCDSQMDVITDTAYDKSISERGVLIPHIKDHCHKSTAHVGDVTSVYKQLVSLKELGLNLSGKTTCFIMESNVREDYDEDVYKFYKNGKINQHSIGLCYVSLGMCINDKEYLQEHELWQKYYDKVINKDKIDEKGYFFIVPEIKIMENSCVLFGANELTPTLSIDNNKSFDGPGNDPTHNEPPKMALNIEKMAEYFNK